MLKLLLTGIFVIVAALTGCSDAVSAPEGAVTPVPGTIVCMDMGKTLIARPAKYKQ